MLSKRNPYRKDEYTQENDRESLEAHRKVAWKDQKDHTASSLEHEAVKTAKQIGEKSAPKPQGEPGDGPERSHQRREDSKSTN